MQIQAESDPVESTSDSDPVVRVTGLRVELSSGREIVDGISFDLRRGQILCLVGESGSGKTTVSTALLAYARSGAHIVAGTVELHGEDILIASAGRRRDLRGETVAYVAQDPNSAFNPALRIATQMTEAVLAHGWDKAAARARIAEVLVEVGLPASKDFIERYPHQLSGGQLQRVGIAMALMLRPDVLVLDEPTTGLDVTTQSRVLVLVRDLCSRNGIGALYVTHDLAVVADIADRVIVMLEGRVVEEATAAELFTRPQHEYTQQLLQAVPDVAAADLSGPTPDSDRRSTILAVEGLNAAYRHERVLHDISFEVTQGECLAIVGESGSGKSTLSRCLIGLHPEQDGAITWDQAPLDPRSRRRSAAVRKDIQYIFQSPHNSLNPRRTVGESIGRAHAVVVGGSAAPRRAAVAEVLERVGLRPDMAGLYPRGLSGGERQRVAIARALVCRPKLLICDEITSALDVIVQASILDLLRELQRADGLSMIFVTHNLAVVRNLADRVMVMNAGNVVEIGDMDAVLSNPSDSYSRELVDNTLSMATLRGERWVASG
ncbi:ABC transporter ATP-binding protein [Aeromicrobium sp. 9AM]|uniref:dipeptide ABC transporter ATP-binding protein n=1 Tax=Aeromicrobium sp. 9AM TaxID=2653126 RepID=UPI0012F4107D|nr:ABC transporter ATP-binding protein [Aeromicrobium sp. 9AM]VXB63127.1 Glutathione import ATP-binding protein GsiA [Aeromicrobium sp. 9AM]